MVNPTMGDDSTMPGDYEPFSGAGNRPFGGSAPQPMVPPNRTPFPQLPSNPPPSTYPGRTPFPRIPPTTRSPRRRATMVPSTRPVARRRRRRRRPLTPEIVIDRRHRSRSHCGGRRVFTIPLDHRPTLGLRGPPRRVVEIERVRCCRPRRHRSVCYDYEYDDPPPAVQQPTIVANPVLQGGAQPSILAPMMNNVPVTATTAAAAAFSNLNAETINNLPRQTVHLPPIHLPGSHADANTELETVVFPAEIINPIDGTLSIIQANPGANPMAAPNIQPFAISATPSPLMQTPNTFGTRVTPRIPLVSPAMANDPLMQKFQSIFQRLSIPQTQPASTIPDPPVLRATSPGITLNQPPIVPSTSMTNIGAYPRANIQPASSVNIGTYRPANMIPSAPLTNPPYRPSSFTPSAPLTNPTYRPSSYTPSALVNNPTYRPTSAISSAGSDIGPYQRANITPYSNLNNRPLLNNSLTQPPTSFEPTPYTSTPFNPSAPRTPFPRPYPTSSPQDNNTSTFNQTINSMPKSILRHPTSSIRPPMT